MFDRQMNVYETVNIYMDIYIDDIMFGAYIFVDPSGRCWVDIDVQSKKLVENKRRVESTFNFVTDSLSKSVQLKFTSI